MTFADDARLPGGDIRFDEFTQLFRRIEPADGVARLHLPDPVQKRLKPRIALPVEVDAFFVDETILAELPGVLVLFDGVVAEALPEEADEQIVLFNLLQESLLGGFRACSSILLEHPGIHPSFIEGGFDDLSLVGQFVHT